MKEIEYALKENAKKDKITVVQVRVLEWFQKSYGNSYFAGTVELFSGSELVRRIILDFQYGYGSHAEYTAAGEIGFSTLWELREFCKENKIHYSFSKEENCRERDLKNLVRDTLPFPVEDKVRCNHCMAVFTEQDIIKDDTVDSGELCPFCKKSDALMNITEEELRLFEGRKT